MEIITAVGVVIINSKKKILIAKRKPDKPMPNKWEFPGGKLEENETLEECGIREVKEELDLDIRIDSYLGFEDLKHKEQKFCLHIYTAHLINEIQMLKLNEHTDSAWIAMSELFDYDLPANKLKFIKKLQENIKTL